MYCVEASHWASTPRALLIWCKWQLAVFQLLFISYRFLFRGAGTSADVQKSIRRKDSVERTPFLRTFSCPMWARWKKLRKHFCMLLFKFQIQNFARFSRCANLLKCNFARPSPHKPRLDQPTATTCDETTVFWYVQCRFQLLRQFLKKTKLAFSGGYCFQDKCFLQIYANLSFACSWHSHLTSSAIQ